MDINYRYLQNNGDYSVVRYECMYPLYLFVTNNIKEATKIFDFYNTIYDLKNNIKCSKLPNFESDCTLGFTVLVSTKEGNCCGVLIYLKDIDKDTIYSTIAHESVHCADAIFQYINAYSQDYDNTDEPFAYLVDWCFTCGYDYIKCVQDNKLKTVKTNATRSRKKNDFLDKKLRWDLLSLEDIEDIVRVYTKGSEKYGDNNWQKLDNGYERYKGAMLRHLVEYEKGNTIDDETGCLHLAQVAWNAIAMLHFSKQTSTNDKLVLTKDLLHKLDERILTSINKCNTLLDEIETKNKNK